MRKFRNPCIIPANTTAPKYDKRDISTNVSFQVAIKCETPVDPYSFVDEEMSMGGMRTASSPGGGGGNPESMTCPGGAQPGLGTPTSTPPGALSGPQHHQMNLVMNGAASVNPQLAHQPKKRGRKKKSEMILTPEE